MFRGQPWGNAKHYRPAPDGHQRDSDYPNVRWLDKHGVVHQASGSSNLTLCEDIDRFYMELRFQIMEATTARVTCIACMGMPEWSWYPIE